MFVSTPPEGRGHHSYHIPGALLQDSKMVDVLRNTTLITLMIILSVVASSTDAITTKSADMEGTRGAFGSLHKSSQADFK